MEISNKHFLKLLDYQPSEINLLLQLAHKLKADKKAGCETKMLKGKNIVLIFEKTSTRTRCAFEVACFDQGANVTYLGADGSQIGHKESIKDTARVLGRMYDAIEYRGYGQDIVEELARYSGVPVFNGLTTEFHPTQALADLMTMQEHSSKPLNEIKFCFIGDAKNNMGNSLMVSAAKMGMDFRACAPSTCQPDKELVSECKDIAEGTGASILVTPDIDEAVNNCDFVCTDVWVSMGEPLSVWRERIEMLLPYQVNADLLKSTNNPNVKFMHCLPAFHNIETRIGADIYEKYKIEALEVSNDVFESRYSVVFDEAENRVHTIKAIMVALMT